MGTGKCAFAGLGEFERRRSERSDAWDGVLGKAGVGYAVYDDDADEARQTAGEVMLKPKGKANG